MQKAEQDTASNGGENADKDLRRISYDELIVLAASGTLQSVDVQLNWSEYYQGQWMAQESGGFGNSVGIDAADNFEQGTFIHVYKNYNEGQESDILIFISGAINVRFRLKSKNNAPDFKIFELDFFTFSEGTLHRPYSLVGFEPTSFIGSSPFKISTGVDGTDQSILQKGASFSLLRGANLLKVFNDDYSQPDCPFFYQDDQHVFYVQPSMELIPIEKNKIYGIKVVIPALIHEDDAELEKIKVFAGNPVLEELNAVDSISPLACFGIESKTDWATDPSTVIQYNGCWIANHGGIDGPPSATARGPHNGSVAIGSTPFGSMLRSTALAGVGLNRITGNGLTAAALTRLLGRHESMNA